MTLRKGKKYHSSKVFVNQLFTNLYEVLSDFESWQKNSSKNTSTFVTKIVNKHDPRYKYQKMQNARKLEINVLAERVTITVIKAEIISPDAKISLYINRRISNPNQFVCLSSWPLLPVFYVSTANVK